MNRFCVTDEIKAEILSLADDGWKADDIADEVGCPVRAIYRVASGRLKAKGGRKAKDLGRLRRIVAAEENATRGERDDLARRFGLKNRRSFDSTACYARRVLAAEERARA